MAEMTAAELRKLAEDRTFGGANDFYEYVVKHKKEIVALIELQAAEIAKKDRMLLAAVEQLRDYADEYTGRTAEQWLAWLEKEAEVQG